MAKNNGKIKLQCNYCVYRQSYFGENINNSVAYSIKSLYELLLVEFECKHCVNCIKLFINDEHISRICIV